MAQIDKHEVTIASSGTTSGVLDLSPSYNILGFFTPSAMTGTSITFTASSSLGGTYGAVQDGAGNSISKTIPTNAVVYIPLNPQDFIGLRYVKLVSGSSEASDRTITVMVSQL